MAPTTSASGLISSVYDAFRRGDIPAILNQVAPDAQWQESQTLPWGGVYRGPEGAAEFFRKLDATMETVGFEPRENVERGDEVFSFGSYSGKSRKSGRSATAEWMFRWRVQDGKIVLFDSHIDTAALLSAM